MKEEELRKNSICAICHKGVGHNPIPSFWLLKVERHVLDLSTIQRQSGMEMMMGGHVALAQVMGPNAEMTKCLMETVTITICESCGTDSELPIAVIVGDRKEDDHV